MKLHTQDHHIELPYIIELFLMTAIILGGAVLALYLMTYLMEEIFYFISLI